MVCEWERSYCISLSAKDRLGGCATGTSGKVFSKVKTKQHR
jgi:hypothetical protein